MPGTNALGVPSACTNCILDRSTEPSIADGAGPNAASSPETMPIVEAVIGRVPNDCTPAVPLGLLGTTTEPVEPAAALEPDKAPSFDPPQSNVDALKNVHQGSPPGASTTGSPNPRTLEVA